MLVAPADEKQSSSVGAIYVPLLRSSIRSSGTFYQRYAPNGALSCRTSTEISQYATQN